MYINHTVNRWISLAVLLCCIVLCSQAASATATKEGSSRFSLLTCAAGDEIYSHFGHTAIRYENPANGIDVVFNYGVFSFNTPNFIYRFVKGETDYMLGAVDFTRFKREYEYYNRTVWQQELNLTETEKTKLMELLQTNYQPANRVYRYNFFYDNCATRPRDKIEECISGEVIYATKENRYTFRDIIYQSTKGYEWNRFGMDVCLGDKADRPINYREEMFSPLYLMEAFKDAIIVDENKIERPLIDHTTEIVSAKTETVKAFLFTPMRTAHLLLILIVSATIYGIRKQKSLWGIDLVLFALAGLAGCVIAFLSCCSEHPAVSPNYLIFVLHPLHLFLLPFFLRKEIKGMKSYYHLANTVVLTLFILIWPIIPQHFNLAVLPLALCLLIRSTSNLVLTYKKEK